MKDSHVYVIGGDGTNRVKIGIAHSPEQRLRALQTGSPLTLRLLASFPADTATEKRLHRWFREFNVHGEWFEFPDGHNVVQAVSEALHAGEPSHPVKPSSSPGEMLPIGERIRALREARGLTMQSLATALGVSRQTLHSIEKGRYSPSLPLAFVIVEFFGMTFAETFLSPVTASAPSAPRNDREAVGPRCP